MGNVLETGNSLILLPVQPHWCGERDDNLTASIADDGSAPLVWGTLGGFYFTRARYRFSPTGVGNVIATP